MEQHRPRLRAVSGEDDELVRAISALGDQLKRIDKRIPNDERVPHPQDPWLLKMVAGALIGMLVTAILAGVAMPSAWKQYHDNNTPAPEVYIRDAEHDRRLKSLEDYIGRLDARVRSVERRGGTPESEDP